jgi:hypothetical protein
MAAITLVFSEPLNESVQVGDTVYYLNTANHTLASNIPVASGGDGASIPYGSSGDIIEIGVIDGVNYASNTITSDIPNYTVRPTSSSYIMFSKDNRVNMASLAGYYAEVEMVNNDNIKIELFSVATEIVESSK